MQILFLGTRGSIPAPGSQFAKYGGNTTSVVITGNKGTTLIIDAGTGIRSIAKYTDVLKQPVINLLFTHAHWDHLQGFPFFSAIYNKAITIRILIARQHFKSIKNCLIKQMSGDSFPIHFDQIPANIEMTAVDNHYIIDDDLQFSIFENNHPSGAAGVRCQSENDVITFITDNEIKLLKEEGQYSDFVNFCSDSNILAHDGQYTEQDMKIKKGWGHSTIDDVATLFIDTKSRIGIITHHDSERTDREVKEFEKRLQKKFKQLNITTRIIAAREGTTWST